MRLTLKYILIIVAAFTMCCSLPAVASEMEKIEMRLRSLAKPQRLLDMAKALGLSKSATWADVEPLLVDASSNFGVRSISVKSNIKTVRGIVLIGSEPPEDDPNLVITAVSVRSDRGLTTYYFQSGIGYVPRAKVTGKSPHPTTHEQGDDKPSQPANNGEPQDNRRSAPRRPPEGPPPAKPGSAPR